eukprot:TRINITY_DN28263_c0_g4_i1.p1 TRINITY_DN28263_c0_g4~~TRINITY_DN28263_c0_g4_i1.p1  ORF type:complete len:758 (+),score=106.13 TRINITY_DN28263_c0_g4_i1:27-2300(+)
MTFASSQVLTDVAHAFCRRWCRGDIPFKAQFGASQKRNEKLYRKLNNEFSPLLSQAHEFRRDASPSLAMQLKVAIFLDQQSRNERAVPTLKGPGLTDDLYLAANEVAAAVVSADITSNACGADDEIWELLPWVSVVVRHTLRDSGAAHETIRDSVEKLLVEAEKSAPESFPWRPYFEECIYEFRRETLRLCARIRDRQWVRDMLREPALKEGAVRMSPPTERCCLAPEAGDACLESSFEVMKQDLCAKFFQVYQDSWKRFVGNADLSSLAPRDYHIVLSFSGGVDSTAHLAIMSMLAAEIPEFSFSCMYIRHRNRSDAETAAELEWCEFLCSTFGAKLFHFDMCVKRAHGETESGETDCGLTREEYERYTKQIRMRLYREVAHRMNRDAKVVVSVLGHHLDDCDENRIEQLSRGHVFGDLDGMAEWVPVSDDATDLCEESSSTPSAESESASSLFVWRPFLRSHRKQAFYDVLQSYRIPYMRDSTPAWSVRGRTRRILDRAVDLQPSFVSDLDVFSRQITALWKRFADDYGLESRAELLSDELSYDKNLVPASQTKAATKFNFRVRKNSDQFVDVVHMPLPRLNVNGDELVSLLSSKESAFECLRTSWNCALQSVAEEAQNDLDAKVLQIPALEEDVNAILFERVLMSTVREFFSSTGSGSNQPHRTKRHGHYHTSAAVAANRRAIKHVWRNIVSAKQSTSGGGFTEELGYVLLKDEELSIEHQCPQGSLILYSSTQADVDYKSLKIVLARCFRNTS